MGRNGALGACAALALGAGAARGQTTAIVFDASLDYVNWSAAIDANPGDTVYVRMRVRLDGATALGLAGITCQPTLTNWNAGAGDVVLPWSEPLAGSHVYFEPYNTGRIYPFTSSGTGASGVLTGFVDGGSLLRFAGSKNVTPTTNLAWGVLGSQLTQNLGGTNFQSSLFVITFVYGVQLGDAGDRTMLASAPREFVDRQRGTWYMQSNGLNSLNADVGDISTATIHVVPSPELGGFVACGLLAGSRRRRAGGDR